MISFSLLKPGKIKDRLLNPSHNCIRVTFPETSNSKGRDYFISRSTDGTTLNFDKISYKRGSFKNLSGVDFMVLADTQKSFCDSYASIGGRIYSCRNQTVIAKHLAESRGDSPISIMGYRTYLKIIRKQTFFKRLITKFDPKMQHRDGELENWETLRVETSYPLYVDFDEFNDRWKGPKTILFDKAEFGGERKIKIFYKQSRKVICNSKQFFMSGRFVSKVDYLKKVREVGVGAFFGAYKFLGDDTLSGGKKLSFGGKGEDDGPREFLRVFDYCQRSCFSLSLRRSHFEGDESLLNVNLFETENLTKFFVFLPKISGENLGLPDGNWSSSESSDDFRILRRARIEHLELDIEPALSPTKINKSERSKLIKLKTLKEIDIELKFEHKDLLEAPENNSGFQVIRVDCNFRNLLMTDTGEGVISLNDMEKLLRICEEYNQGIMHENKRIRIDRKNLKNPISDFSYALAVDFVLSWGSLTFNCPYVILIDKQSQKYVVIGLRELVQGGGEFMDLAVDGLL